MFWKLFRKNKTEMPPENKPTVHEVGYAEVVQFSPIELTYKHPQIGNFRITQSATNPGWMRIQELLPTGNKSRYLSWSRIIELAQEQGDCGRY
jgi:hypothetical protein